MIIKRGSHNIFVERGFNMYNTILQYNIIYINNIKNKYTYHYTTILIKYTYKKILIDYEYYLILDTKLNRILLAHKI